MKFEYKNYDDKDVTRVIKILIFILFAYGIIFYLSGIPK